MTALRAMMLTSLCLVGCTRPNEASCVDDFCNNPALPFCDVDGTIGGDENTCIAVDCEPGTFVACRGDEAITCRASGVDYDVASCPLGCDDTIGCIETACEVGTTRCGAGTLERCNDIGEYVSEACAAGCIDAPEPHCAYLEPRYLPDVCDVPALEVDPRLDDLELGEYVNTDAVQVCTGGVVAQTDGAPDICVVRYNTIRQSGSVTTKVAGTRVLALVADASVHLEGTLDVSADGQIDGPGAGTFESGGGAWNHGGGGGGGSSEGAPGGPPGVSNAGAIFNPSPFLVLRGGAAHPPSYFDGTLIFVGEAAGGRGGAMTAIACRGTTSVTGLLDAGGGGGHRGDAVSSFGGGGGSGGFAALQGLNVSVTGRVYSNGGCGGDGKATNPALSRDGCDGIRASAYTGTTLSHDGGRGGRAGVATLAPERGGGSATRAGGGGGSMGAVVAFVPDGVTPTLAATEASPPLEASRSVQTR